MITCFHPHQNEEDLKAFVAENDCLVLSFKPLTLNHIVVFQENLAPPDDALRCFLEFLEGQPDGNYTFVDWESLYKRNVKEEFDKLKLVKQGFEIVEEDVRLQDFRFAPFMENLLQICQELKMPGIDRLFKDNPKLLIPKILRGSKTKLVEGLKRFVELRRQIRSPKFTGVIPIFNSEFFV